MGIFPGEEGAPSVDSPNSSSPTNASPSIALHNSDDEEGVTSTDEGADGSRNRESHGKPVEEGGTDSEEGPEAHVLPVIAAIERKRD